MVKYKDVKNKIMEIVMRIYIENVEKTIELGKLLGESLQAGMVVCLDGDLGAGKTHFSKGIALGLEIEEDITSPTFTIVQEYKGRMELFHFDAYRLSGSEELYYIGFDDYLNKKGIIVIEWSNIVSDVLPKERLDIEINYAPDKGRFFEFKPYGEAYMKLIEDIMIKAKALESEED